MLYSCYLRRNAVYVPTVGRRGGAYTEIEPISVVPAANIDGLRRAFLDTIDRKNIAVPLLKGKRPPPALLKYAGVKSWSAFARNASTWSIKENGGLYQIVGHKRHPEGYWVEDAEQKTDFPPGSTIDDVIDRMIAILQDAAQKQSR
jgi:hypothetical protein